MKEDYLSITEMAKLRKVTTETLRHYDRVGLFKPGYVDPDTGYRYYSVLQYEKLGTIIELRQLGMSIDEIKEYFNERNLNKSTAMLKKQHDKLLREIQEKEKLESTIARKLEFLDEMKKLPRQQEVIEREIPDRYMISYNEPKLGGREMAYEFLKLERYLDETAPILATNRVGVYTNKKLDELSGKFAFVPMILCDKTNKKILYAKKIPGGKYVCMYYNGKFGQYMPFFDKIKEYIKEKNYEVCGPIYQTYQIDITLTDSFSETIIEIQVPVKDKI